MNRDYFSIDAELDASWGPSTQSKVLLPIPENVRGILRSVLLFVTGPPVVTIRIATLGVLYEQ
jgi:hypothetical protein